MKIIKLIWMWLKICVHPPDIPLYVAIVFNVIIYFSLNLPSALFYAGCCIGWEGAMVMMRVVNYRVHQRHLKFAQDFMNHVAGNTKIPDSNKPQVDPWVN